MLVANPGQTSSYVLHSKKTCHTAANANSSSVISSSSNVIIRSSSITKIANNNSLAQKSARHVLVNNCVGSASNSTKTLPLKFVAPTADNSTTNKLHTNSTNNYNNTSTTNCSSSTTTSTSSALMKTLSVRLNRGTEFLKETVQKALISKIPSHLSSVLNLNLYTVPPTATHRFPAERLNVSSADSLHTEMCHFKPIRTAPTTPWKSNSKSRGASLKMPKACLATKVKLDCEDGAGDGTSLETEGFLQFRPKPNSTLLTTIFTTPSRQSAFVCLVAQMKTIVDMKSKQINSMEQNLHKTKLTRGRTKSKANIAFLKSTSINVPLSELILRKRRNPFVNVKKLNLPTELIITRSSIRNSRVSPRAAPSVTTAVDVSKSKSKSSLAMSKSIEYQNNKKNKSQTVVNSQRRARKRKLPSETGIVSLDAEVARPTLRKSARLSKDCCIELVPSMFSGSRSYGRLSRRQSAHVQHKRSSALFSPPLTRSRLKQMSEQKLSSALC